jgi:hypothetical protein
MSFWGALGWTRTAPGSFHFVAGNAIDEGGFIRRSLERRRIVVLLDGPNDRMPWEKASRSMDAKPPDRMRATFAVGGGALFVGGFVCSISYGYYPGTLSNDLPVIPAIVICVGGYATFLAACVWRSSED